MNDKLLMSRIKQNKLNEISRFDLIYIISNKELKLALIDVIDKYKKFPYVWVDYFDDFSEFSELMDSNKDFFDCVYYYYYLKEEKDNLLKYQKNLLLEYKYFDESFPRVYSLFQEDSVKYYNDLIDLIEKAGASYITNPLIIKYIINTSNSKLFRRCDYNSIQLTDEELIKAFEMVSEEPNFYHLKNPQLIEYIMSNNYSNLYYIIQYNIYSFTGEQVVKYINYLIEEDVDIEIYNPILVNYILDNKVKKLYHTIKIDKCNFSEEQLPVIINVLREDMVDNRIDYNGHYYNNPSFIRYIIENNIEDLYKVIDLNSEKISEDLIPKVIDIMKILKDDYPFTTSNTLLIDYIINNEVRELYDNIYKVTTNNNLDFNKDTFYKLLDFKYNSVFYRYDFPIVDYLERKSPEEVDRFFELLKVRELSIKDLKNINESLQQYIYRQENNKVVGIFGRIKAIADNKRIPLDTKELLIKSWVNKFLSIDCIPNYLVKDLINKNKELSIKEKKRLFLYEVLNKVVIDNEFKPYLEILHEITDSYVATMANNYSNKNNIDTINTIIYNYDIKDNRREVIRKIFNYLNINNHDVLMKILNDNGYIYNKIEKDQFKEARDIFLKWLEDKVVEEGNNSILPTELHFLFDDKEFVSTLKKDISYKKRNLKLNDAEDMFSIKELKVIFDEVINDDKKYNKLLDILNKYKVLEWPLVFNEQIFRLYGENFYDLYSFISNFSSIYDKNNDRFINDFVQSDEYKKLFKKMKENYSKDSNIDSKKLDKLIRDEIINNIDGNYLVRPYRILNDYNTYASYNLVYKIILGSEDYNLIKENPAPNAANKDKNETKLRFTKDRLEKAISYYLKMLKLHEVTVPSFSKIITLSNGKKIRVIVGNRTSSRNITLGERTESCMRIRGVGHDLFEFCNLDPRGFHIIFEDVNSNKLVSRISGYRNGNTVFLNQLRHSLVLNYDNDDLIEALRMVANDIIEVSNKLEVDDKEIPIENVIADCNCALASEKSIKAPFKQKTIAIPKYTDIGKDNIVVIATNATKQEMSPIILQENDQHVYKSVRIKPSFINEFDKDVSNYIKKMIIIRDNLNDEDEYNFNSIEFDRDDIVYKKAYIADDWVVYLSMDNKIKIVSISSDERSYEEIDKAILSLSSELDINNKRRK
ncbi:MAG: hypothetical protein VZS44_02785 [Bacilli bacterium]|nr:hypothetical protein [Bacilli bacterium]